MPQKQNKSRKAWMLLTENERNVIKHFRRGVASRRRMNKRLAKVLREIKK
jgi:hypothetical protein